MGERTDLILLLGKSILVIIGMILLIAGLVDLFVAGWNVRAAGALAAGILLAVPPLALAFRDALREAKKGRL